MFKGIFLASIPSLPFNTLILPSPISSNIRFHGGFWKEVLSRWSCGDFLKKISASNYLMEFGYDSSFCIYAYKLLDPDSKLVLGPLNDDCVVGCENACNFIILTCHKSILVYEYDLS